MESALRKKRLYRAAECPECGDYETMTEQKGHDTEGRVIRRRKCQNCDQSFGTIELVLPEEFVFGSADTDRRDKNRHIRALRSADEIIVGRIKLKKGKPTDVCMKGKHRLKGNNLKIVWNTRTRRNQRMCRACERDAKHRYRMINKDRILARKREAYHRNVEVSRAKQRIAYRRRKEQNDISRSIAREDDNG